MAIGGSSITRPAFTSNKVAFKADEDKQFTKAERQLIESGWGSDAKTYDESQKNKMSLTKKVLIGAGVVLLGIAATLRIAKPETVKTFVEAKNWIPNFVKTGFNRTSEFLNKYLFGAGSEGAWGKLFRKK